MIIARNPMQVIMFCSIASDANGSFTSTKTQMSWVVQLLGLDLLSSISFEKRFSIRPVGVVSKKDVTAASTLFNMRL